MTRRPGLLTAARSHRSRDVCVVSMGAVKTASSAITAHDGHCGHTTLRSRRAERRCDTLKLLPIRGALDAVDWDMPAKGEAMPQQHKGDRTLVSTRIPTPYFHKMQRLTMATGQTKSDILADILLAYLDNVDLDEMEGQDRLPMTA